MSVLGSTLRNVISLTNVSFIGNDILSATSDGGGALITFLSDVEPTSTGDPRLVLVLNDVRFINNSVGALLPAERESFVGMVCLLSLADRPFLSLCRWGIRRWAYRVLAQ